MVFAAREFDVQNLQCSANRRPATSRASLPNLRSLKTTMNPSSPTQTIPLGHMSILPAHHDACSADVADRFRPT